jgi:hypothetical protein
VVLSATELSKIKEILEADNNKSGKPKAMRLSEL